MDLSKTQLRLHHTLWLKILQLLYICLRINFTFIGLTVILHNLIPNDFCCLVLATFFLILCAPIISDSSSWNMSCCFYLKVLGLCCSFPCKLLSLSILLEIGKLSNKCSHFFFYHKSIELSLKNTYLTRDWMPQSP
jgi:hypothetical protein